VRRTGVAVLSFPRVRRVVQRPRWGNLRRLRPFSEHYGRDRGTPVDRWYIDAFIAAHADDIRGRVLELADRRYTKIHGDGVDSFDVLDVDPRNDNATIIADLDDAGALPESSFECVVFTQTLQYVADPATTLVTLWRSLAPGGVLLMTVPTIAKVEGSLSDRDAWRVLPVGAARLVARTCPGAEVDVTGRGNLLAAVAFLLGIASEELTAAELGTDDPSHPLVTCVRVRRAAA
jgi:SAM-dependent methyltransferase